MSDPNDCPQGWYNPETEKWDKEEPSLPTFVTEDKN